MRMSNPRRAGRALVAVGVFGVLASVVGVVVGWRLVTELDTAVGRSLTLTSEALVALESSVEVAEGALVLIDTGLASTETTTRDVSAALEEGEELFDATATLTEDQIATSLEAVEGTLPSLIEVAGVIDRTLSALSALPLGPAYDPQVPFDESLRGLQSELDGLPEDLRAQADLIRGAGGSLATVRDGTGDIADSLAELQTALSASAELLGEYTATAGQARELVTESEASLEAQLRLARALICTLGLVLASGQLVPLGAGWLLLHPERARKLLEEG
jgi:hypothetical protein